MGAGPMRLISALTPDTALPLWLVDCFAVSAFPAPYQDENEQDWPDNAATPSQCSTMSLLDFRSACYLPNWRADIGPMPTIGMPA